MVPEPPLVQTVEAAPGLLRSPRFTASSRARTESNLGFRVGGKIFERLVDPRRPRAPGPASHAPRPDRLYPWRSTRLARRSSGPCADDQGQGRRRTQPQACRRRLDLEADLRPEQGGRGRRHCPVANAEAQASQIANQAGYSELQPMPTASSWRSRASPVRWSPPARPCEARPRRVAGGGGIPAGR